MNAGGYISEPITWTKTRWNVADAEWSPNGITVHWNRPFPGTVKGVYCIVLASLQLRSLAISRSLAAPGAPDTHFAAYPAE